jgi:HipA-like protein
MNPSTFFLTAAWLANCGARARARHLSNMTDPGWSGNPRSPLSLPLRQQAYVGAPVLAVFENLLPDNDTLRRQIAARARNLIVVFDLV